MLFLITEKYVQYTHILREFIFYYFWYLLRFTISFVLPTYKYNSEIMSLYRPCLIFQHYHLISNLNRLNLIGYFDIIFKRQANLVLILALTICFLGVYNKVLHLFHLRPWSCWVSDSFLWTWSSSLELDSGWRLGRQFSVLLLEFSLAELIMIVIVLTTT